LLAKKNFTDVNRAGGDFELPPGFVWSLLLYFERMSGAQVALRAFSSNSSAG